jgi:hypothetical protein
LRVSITDPPAPSSFRRGPLWWFDVVMPTRLGIAIMGGVGTFTFALLGMGMLLAPKVFRYVPDVEAILLAAAHIDVSYHYSAGLYGFWAWTHLILSLLWGGLMLRAYVTMPAQTRRIDRVIRARLSPMARGAPLEP